jgi:hypothetical protein
MINGLTGGVFHDDERSADYERAAALDVPIYIHPAPQPAVIEAYYWITRRSIPGCCAPAGLQCRDCDARHPLCAERVFDAHPG